MGRLKYFFLFFLLASSSFAETSPRRDSIGYAACANIGLSENGSDLVTSAIIIQKINGAVRDVCVDFPALPKYDTATIDSTMEGGSLPSDFHRATGCFLLFGDTARVPLVPITSDSLRKLKPSLTNNVMRPDDEPSEYFVIHDTTFSVYPKWRRLSTDSLLYIGINYYALDTTLTAAASATSINPIYLNKVIYHVCAELEAVRANFDRAGYWWKIYGK